MTTTTRWMALGLVALMAAAPAAARQTNNRIDRLTTELELSETQKSAIAGSVQTGDRSMWTLATALQQNLNAEQKEKFLAQGDRMMAFNRGVQTGRRQAVANQTPGRSRVTRRDNRGGQNGQARSPQVRSRQPVVDRMIDSLTDEQKAELKTLRESNGQKMKALRESVQSGDVDREEARKQMATLRKSMREEADGVLTDAQKTRMKEMQTRQRARTTSRRTRGTTVGDRPTRGVRTLGRGHSPEAAAEMAKALGLSTTQVELIKIHATLAAAGSMQRTAIAGTRGARTRDGGQRGRRSNNDR